MEAVTSKRRIALASLIIAGTLFGAQYSHTRHDAARSPAPTPTTEQHNMRAPAPSKPMLWVLGSTLLGLVGLKRFGLYRG